MVVAAGAGDRPREFEAAGTGGFFVAELERELLPESVGMSRHDNTVYESSSNN